MTDIDALMKKHNLRSLGLPNKEQVETAVHAMRSAHFDCGYSRWPKDYYLETMFWAGFFAAYLNFPHYNSGDQ